MEVTKYFSLKELVPKTVYDRFGDNSWEFFTPEILSTLNDIRILFDSIIMVNTWSWGGNFHYRGFRPIDYYEGTLSFSQHIRGNAIDFDVKWFTADEVRKELIKQKQQNKLPYLTGVEENVNWVHIDCRQCSRLNENGLFLFKP